MAPLGIFWENRPCCKKGLDFEAKQSRVNEHVDSYVRFRRC